MGRSDSQRWTVHTTGTLTNIRLILTTQVTHLFSLRVAP